MFPTIPTPKGWCEIAAAGLAVGNQGVSNYSNPERLVREASATDLSQYLKVSNYSNPERLVRGPIALALDKHGCAPSFQLFQPRKAGASEAGMDRVIEWCQVSNYSNPERLVRVSSSSALQGVRSFPTIPTPKGWCEEKLAAISADVKGFQLFQPRKAGARLIGYAPAMIQHSDSVSNYSNPERLVRAKKNVRASVSRGVSNYSNLERLVRGFIIEGIGYPSAGFQLFQPRKAGARLGYLHQQYLAENVSNYSNLERLVRVDLCLGQRHFK